MSKVRAKEFIRLSNGQRMTLGEAITTGRVFLKQVDNYPHKHPKYIAREVGGDVLWEIGEKLYESRRQESEEVVARQRPRDHVRVDPRIIEEVDLDVFDKQHLERWLEHARGPVGDEYRDEAEINIYRALHDDPTLVGERSWEDIELMGKRLEPNARRKLELDHDFMQRPLDTDAVVYVEGDAIDPMSAQAYPGEVPTDLVKAILKAMTRGRSEVTALHPARSPSRTSVAYTAHWSGDPDGVLIEVTVERRSAPKKKPTQTPNPRAEWVQTDEERTDSKGRRVILFQKGRTFRWFNEDGKALSPVQKNIAEALAYAEWVGWHGAVPQYQRPRSTAHDVMQAAFEILTRFPERALFHRPESGKVFIADVLGLLPDLTKEDLYRMNQRGEIRLARIDLTSALDAEEFRRMKASEIQHGSTDASSFHVVIAR